MRGIDKPMTWPRGTNDPNSFPGPRVRSVKLDGLGDAWHGRGPQEIRRAVLDDRRRHHSGASTRVPAEHRARRLDPEPGQSAGVGADGAPALLRPAAVGLPTIRARGDSARMVRRTLDAVTSGCQVPPLASARIRAICGPSNSRNLEARCLHGFLPPLSFSFSGGVGFFGSVG